MNQFVVARGPLPAAPAVSLLTSARPGVLVGEDGQPLSGRTVQMLGETITVPPWIGGYGYRPRGCGPSGSGVVCGDDAQTEKVLEQGLDNPVSVVPWLVWAGDVCSSLPSGEVSEDRARDLLDAHTAHGIEREFWRGDIARAQDYPNPYLADLPTGNDLNGGGAVPVARALPALQQALAASGTGSPGMIHATVRTVSEWFATHGAGLERRGAAIFDVFGNVIVPGTGYDGSSPVVLDEDGDYVSGGEVDETGETAWAYATDMADVFADRIVMAGRSLVETIDKSKNTIETRAERLVAASWERCRHFGINIDLGTAISGIPVREA